MNIDEEEEAAKESYNTAHAKKGAVKEEIQRYTKQGKGNQQDVFLSAVHDA